MDWKLVLTTFGMVFLAELGDKTQLLVFTLSAQHRAPWAVFLGASVALSLVSLLGAFVGGLVGELLPTKYVQIGAGILFVAVGGLVIYRAAAA
ncbi:TMEM165/GDT1 family protein [Candidatus Bipolaricaulota bacterium]|nr:TMEM165/GDT1 family protein [Candidatus Bipolaricaulota bacterium]